MNDETPTFGGTENERRDAQECLELLRHFVELDSASRRKVIEFAEAALRKGNN